MKLTTKVSAIAAIAFFVTTQVFLGVFLYYTWNQNKSITIEGEQNRFDNYLDFLESTVSEGDYTRYRAENRQILIRDLFRRNAKNAFALYNQTEEIYNNTGYAFSFERETEEASGTELQTIDGIQMMVCFQRLELAQREYCVYYIKDISHLYKEVRQQILLGEVIICILTLVVLSVLLVMVRRILHPIYRLRDAAQDIGNGCYHKRVSIMTKDEVGQIATSFNEMAAQIEQSMRELSRTNQQQKQLLGSLGHELRTPMTSIMGYSSTLLRVKLKEEQKEQALQYIYRECERLSRLSAKLMELSTLYQNDSLKLQPVTAERLFREVEESVHFILKEKNISLRLAMEEPQRVYEVEEDLMKNLLINLIDNARKASPEGSVVILKQNSDGFSVEDSGPGIPMGEIVHVKQAFYMVDKSRSKQNGSIGLGLALCEQIARLHHGRLDIANCQGGGARISFHFQ